MSLKMRHRLCDCDTVPDDCLEEHPEYITRRKVICILWLLLSWGLLIGMSIYSYYFGAKPIFYTDEQVAAFSPCKMYAFDKPNPMMDHPPWAYEMLYEAFPNILRADTHAHTDIFPMGDGVLGPLQLPIYMGKLDYNVYFETEHNFSPSDEDSALIDSVAHSVGIIRPPGFEYTTARLHMVFLGIRHGDIPIISPQEIVYPTDGQIKGRIDSVHAIGGIVIAAHLMNKCRNMPSHQQLIAWGVDYIEVINNYSIDPLAYSYYYNRTVGGVCATDTHRPAGTVCHNLLAMQHAPPYSASDILKAFRDHRVAIHYDPGQCPGPEDPGTLSRNYLATIVFSAIGELIMSSSFGAFMGVFLVAAPPMFVLLFERFILHPTYFCQRVFCCWEIQIEGIIRDSRRCTCLCDYRSDCSCRERMEDCCIDRCFPCYMRCCGR